MSCALSAQDITVKRPAVDLYQDTWVATDALGRTMPGYDAVGPVSRQHLGDRRMDADPGTPHDVREPGRGRRIDDRRQLTGLAPVDFLDMTMTNEPGPGDGDSDCVHCTKPRRWISRWISRATMRPERPFRGSIDDDPEGAMAPGGAMGKQAVLYANVPTTSCVPSPVRTAVAEPVPARRWRRTCQ